MGAKMTQRLLRGGHRILVYDIKVEAMRAVAKLGAIENSSVAD